MFSLHQESPDSYKDLTGSFVTILKQVVGGKLPVDFNYHSVPAPWLQIQLLRILSLLGKEDQRYRGAAMQIQYLHYALKRTYFTWHWNGKCVCSFFSTSELMYEVLDESLRRAEMNHNITYGKFIFFNGPNGNLCSKLIHLIHNVSFSSFIYFYVAFVYFKCIN